MCAIIDADVVAEAFGDSTTPAGQEFRKLIRSGKSRLVVGGKLLDELDRNGNFRRWRATAIQYGRVHAVDSKRVELQTDKLRESNVCRSNDQHVIALAQVSGARLLFSNDCRLHIDFKDKRLIGNPPGKVYTTRNAPDITPSHRHLLAHPPVCRMSM